MVLPSFLPVGSSLQFFVLNYLNPVVVGIEDKGNILHATICKSLLPVHAKILEALAGSIKIINRNTCTESA